MDELTEDERRRLRVLSATRRHLLSRGLLTMLDMIDAYGELDLKRGDVLFTEAMACLDEMVEAGLEGASILKGRRYP